MKSLIALGALLLAPAFAHAYPTGSFSCLNQEGLPNNRYEIRNIDVGGVTLPYVEIVRYYKGTGSNPPAVNEVQIKGFAVHSVSARAEYLMVAAVHLEFENGRLLGCRQ